MTGRRLRIGEAAARAAVSVRTLRYYEELGLLTPSAHSPGGARRYAEEDVARLARIRELKDLLGFNLDEVRTVLTAEDRLGDLRAAYHAEDDLAAQGADRRRGAGHQHQAPGGGPGQAGAAGRLQGRAGGQGRPLFGVPGRPAASERRRRARLGLG